MAADEGGGAAGHHPGDSPRKTQALRDRPARRTIFARALTERLADPEKLYLTTLKGPHREGVDPGASGRNRPALLRLLAVTAGENRTSLA